MPAYGYEFYLLVVNSISHSFAALTREISSWPLEDKIHIHARACNILYLLLISNFRGSKNGGSMDPVHGEGPWTRGPCFVLSHSVLFNLHSVCTILTLANLNNFKYHTKIRLCSQANQNHLLRDLFSFLARGWDKWKQIARWSKVSALFS